MKTEHESIKKFSFMVNDNFKLHLKCSNKSTVTETFAEYQAPVGSQRFISILGIFNLIALCISQAKINCITYLKYFSSLLHQSSVEICLAVFSLLEFDNFKSLQ